VWAHLDKLVKREEAAALAQPQIAEDRMEMDVFAMIDAHRAKKPGQGYGEVASYCSLPLESVKCNTLEWWKANETHYPSLAKIARVYLGMLASSATEERVFSRGSLVQTNRRTRLGDDVFESQVLSGFNKLFLQYINVKYY
jgi:hypothetical protein